MNRRILCSLTVIAFIAGCAGTSKTTTTSVVAEKDKPATDQPKVVASSSGPLGVTDVANMVAQGLSDQIIINQIRTTRTVFHLSTSDISYLKQSGVSDPVIVEMQNTELRVQPVVVKRRRPVYVY
jgi:hypothetical protein